MRGRLSRRRFPVLVGLLALLGLVAASAVVEGAEPSLKVFARPLHAGRINPMLFGNFIELLDDLVPGHVGRNAQRPRLRGGPAARQLGLLRRLADLLRSPVGQSGADWAIETQRCLQRTAVRTDHRARGDRAGRTHPIGPGRDRRARPIASPAGCGATAAICVQAVLQVDAARRPLCRAGCGRSRRHPRQTGPSSSARARAEGHVRPAPCSSCAWTAKGASGSTSSR